jgi:hypothetical protein
MICSGESTTQYGKNKDMRKIKFFSCHKFGNYLGHCLHRNKGKKKNIIRGSCIDKGSSGRVLQEV